MEHREQRPHAGNRKCWTLVEQYIFSKGDRNVFSILQQSLVFILRVNWAMSELFFKDENCFWVAFSYVIRNKRKSLKLQLFHI